MKVFICNSTNEAYSACTVIVAANNLEEAKRLIADYDTEEYEDGNSFYRNFYNVDSITESKELISLVETPQILYVNSYQE